MSVLIALHALAAVIWVGGLFFLVGILRPAASSVPLAERLPLLFTAMGRFFLWVWIAIIVLLVTGNTMIFMLGGMAGVPLYIHLMQALGWVMFLLFGHMFFSPWRRVRVALSAGALADALRAMNQLRFFAAINLAIGLLVVVIATGGRYWVG
ncbi:Putative membrane protein [Salinisphaera shabanensis E1L3A]|uniref:Membrane protein n=1 Tax=Salinisphaera shabanensis E1L3A TaxID=1033802 RepID=U2FTB8_9GAMM|nr:CopD family protein [Salinisphaera shabanensis]ERJ19239.1 Putative membrane protein [Salinisphaera shabanensis E1L3A]